jgi:hypothetical protein
MRKLVVGTFSAALMVGLLAGCNVGADPSKGMGDAGINQSTINKQKVDVLEFSDKYPNVEEKCDGHGHRVFTNTRSSGFFVVVDDPACG